MKYLIVKQRAVNDEIFTTVVSADELAEHIRCAFAYTSVKIISIVLIS